jgi:hypothetical protein
VASVLSSISLNISFRGALVGDKLRVWTKPVSAVVQVGLVEAEDQFVWKVNNDSMFSVKSMNRDLMEGSNVPEKCTS